MTTIRICEMKDALLMLEEGTFLGFLRMWSDRFPYTGIVSKMKAYKEEHGCTLQEARASVAPGRDVAVDFGIGDGYILRKRNGKLSLLARVKGIWTEAEEDTSLEGLCDGTDVHFPVFTRRLIDICSPDELKRACRKGSLKALARVLAKRVRTGTSPYSLFCGDEIWRVRGLSALHIDSVAGTRDVPFTTRGILGHLEEYCAALRDREALLRS